VGLGPVELERGGSRWYRRRERLVFIAGVEGSLEGGAGGHVPRGRTDHGGRRSPLLFHLDDHEHNDDDEGDKEADKEAEDGEVLGPPASRLITLDARLQVDLV